MRVYAKLWLFFCGIYLKVKGREMIINKQPYIICSNHSSFLDIPCLYAIFQDYFVFTGKQEIEKWPLFHIFYTSGMNILVDRKSSKGILKGVKKMMTVLEKRKPLMIFPEGTISKKAPQLTAFKSGAISLAIKNQTPILPITFIDNWKRLQRSSFFKGKAGPGKSRIVIHEPIYTKGKTKSDTASLQKKLYDVINNPLNKAYGVS